MATPIDVVMLKCRKISLTGKQWNRALFNSQKNLAAFQTVATARITPKICKRQPSTYWFTLFQIWFQIGSLSAEL